MSAPTARRRGLPALLLLLAGATACDETDELLVDSIGTSQFFLVDIGLQTTSPRSDQQRIQVAEWDVREATLLYADRELDLLFGDGDGCRITETVFVPPVSDGRCNSGIVLEAETTPQPVRLRLSFDMQVRRAKPLSLPPQGDFDGDGRRNDADNCVLIPNPDQADLDQDGNGDACTVFNPFTGEVFVDSDGDGFIDGSDNCAWVANPSQADTRGVGGSGIPDGIGDACEEQVAVVRTFSHLRTPPFRRPSRGGVTVELRLGVNDYVQPRNRSSFFTVEMDSRRTLRCDWDAGECLIDPNALRFCVRQGVLANLGCL